MIQSFGEQVLNFAEFSATDIQQFNAALGSAVGLVELRVEQGGDVGLPITVAAVVDDTAIEFAILEHGRPLDRGDDVDRDMPDRLRPTNIFDRVWWVHRGPEGSELHLRKSRTHPEIATLTAAIARSDAEAAERAAAEDLAATDANYNLRPFRESDALEVSRCIYEAYGYTYPNPDLFFPDRIIALNRDGRLRSLVAETASGEVVGHYALERPDLGPIAEAGQAVVHHAHRGRGLMRSMRSAVENEGRERELLGIWSQPTARHPFSQKMNLAFGSVPCGLSLGTTPSNTMLRGDATPNSEDATRQSCFLYWHPLTDEPPLTANVPEVLVPILSEIYQVRGRDVTFDTTPRKAEACSGATAAVHTVFDRVRNVGRIWVDRIGDTTADVIGEAVAVMQEAADAETIFIDLPIDDPACAATVASLLKSGFVFSGIGPRFHCRTNGGEDTLRLQMNFTPVDLDGLVAEGELGQRILEFILESQ